MSMSRFKVAVALFASAIFVPTFNQISSAAGMVESQSLFIGAGVFRSTFTADPSSSTPSMSLSQGLKLGGGGGVEFPDGSRRFSADNPGMVFSTRTAPISTFQFTASFPNWTAVPGSTTSITTINEGSLIKADYTCDSTNSGENAVYLFFLQENELFGGEDSAGIAAAFRIGSSTKTISGSLFAGPVSAGIHNFSLMATTNGGAFAKIRIEQECALSLAEFPK